ncbi:protease inhibitor Inh/omp19 family protein [Rhizobium sp. LjRoot30]|uniref:protease inhibitor Inh/omp19 family protein n=1 Tax=Rhizobium sp. LjRoot30 TaxID=3342320 RepID=UPI003ECC6133
MQLKHAAVGLAVVLSLAGCQRTTYSDLSPTRQVTPLEAQPVQGVQSSQLPDPTADASQFPEKPTTLPTDASAQTTDAMAATALDVKKEGMVGNWKVNTSGVTCDMFLTLTNLGSGSRGGTRGCSGELTTMGSWEVDGKQVMLKDRSGNPLGRLYKTADTRFDGTTNSGQPISLSR